MLRRPRSLTIPGIALAALLVGACSDDSGRSPRSGDDRVPNNGAELVVETVVDGLVAPTQFAVLADGSMVIAQLNGGEGDGTGQVVHVEFDGSGDVDSAEVLFDELLTPTGVAVIGDRVWVMERRTLSVGPLDGGTRSIVLDDLAFNGRSEGSLGVTDDGLVRFDTSGSLRNGEVVEGSGTLWEVGEDGAPRPIATGFKHAYAQVQLPDGRLVTTEISDGTFDGEAAADELVVVEPGLDHGWPACVGDRIPVVQFGGTAQGCAASPPSLAVFEPGATPSSVAVVPWDPTRLAVALWNRGLVVTVPIERPADAQGNSDQSSESTMSVLYAGVAHPQHLVADGDRLLLSDLDGGRILSLRPGP